LVHTWEALGANLWPETVLYICGLFNDAVHSLDNVASNDMMLDNELDRLLKEIVVYMPEGTEENHKKPQSKQPVSV
jgi:hypothetical protein